MPEQHGQDRIDALLHRRAGLPDDHLHQQFGGQHRDRPDIIVWGSVSVARSLFAAGEVDEVELFIAPTLLGSGTPLLATDDRPVSLRLQDTESWPANVIRTRYAVKAH